MAGAGDSLDGDRQQSIGSNDDDVNNSVMVEHAQITSLTIPRKHLWLQTSRLTYNPLKLRLPAQIEGLTLDCLVRVNGERFERQQGTGGIQP